MSASDVHVLRRSIALLAAALTMACDDPMATRPVPDESRLALFALIDPDMPSVPVLIQQPHGALVDFTLSATTAGSPLATSTVTAPDSLHKLFIEMQTCGRSYRFTETITAPWLFRCGNLGFVPQHGVTYEVSLASPGRPTARGTTTVPGDFEIVSHIVEEQPSGDIRVEAVWRSSPGVHRYIVSIIGFTAGQPMPCHPDTECHDRWFVVTQDTTISTVIPASYFEHSDSKFQPYGLAVYAMDRALFGYMMTGVSSDFFPVPPAQNVIGGFGGVGSWVRRAAQTLQGVSVSRVHRGLRVTNNTGADVRYEVVQFDSPTTFATCHFSECPTLANGDTVVIPQSDFKGFTGQEFFYAVHLLLWNGTTNPTRIPVYIY